MPERSPHQPRSGTSGRFAAASYWLRDRIADLGDRAGFHPGLLGFATRFPLTRPVARRRAAALFDLCAGFVYSQVLVAGIDLGLFESLRDGPLAEPALATRLALTEPATRRLLLAAEPLRLVKRAGPGRWRLGPLGRAVAADPGIGAMIAHHRLLYADLADPAALLRGERDDRALGAFWAYTGTEDSTGLAAERTRLYTRLMSASQAMVSREVIRVVPFAHYRKILDVGGGDGTFLEAVARAAPALDLTLFDLPAVATEAEARFSRAGLTARAKAIGGDFRRDLLPRGADLISLVRVLHDHDDASVRALLLSARRALEPGGTLLVAEPMAEARGAEKVGGAYFGFYLLAMGQGRARSADELSDLLREAGFSRVERRPTSLPIVTGVILAHVPSAEKV